MTPCCLPPLSTHVFPHCAQNTSPLLMISSSLRSITVLVPVHDLHSVCLWASRIGMQIPIQAAHSWVRVPFERLRESPEWGFPHSPCFVLPLPPFRPSSPPSTRFSSHLEKKERKGGRLSVQAHYRSLIWQPLFIFMEIATKTAKSVTVDFWDVEISQIRLCGLLQKRWEWNQCFSFFCVCVCVGSLCDLVPQPLPPVA